ncbi:MAG: hypothetical protein ABIQ06_06280 [Caldimonas sp.]
MTSLSARMVPVALVLALVSAGSVAEDRPNTTLIQKSKTSAVTSSTPKARTQAPTSVNGAATIKAGTKPGAAAAGAAAPSAERAYEGCEGKGADA